MLRRPLFTFLRRCSNVAAALTLASRARRIVSEGAKNSSSSPSFIDLHIHGAFGVDVLTASAADMDRLASALAARGVSGFLPTLVPLPLAEMAKTVTRLSAWMRSRRPGDGKGAMPLGIHFEGPFVSRARCGALHREDFLDGTDDHARSAPSSRSRRARRAAG